MGANIPKEMPFSEPSVAMPCANLENFLLARSFSFRGPRQHSQSGIVCIPLTTCGAAITDSSSGWLAVDVFASWSSMNVNMMVSLT